MVNMPDMFPIQQFEIQVCFVYKIIAITLELWYKFLQTECVTE